MREAIKLIQEAVKSDKRLQTIIDGLNQKRELVEKSIVIENLNVNSDCKKILRKLARVCKIEESKISLNANDYWPEEIFILNLFDFFVKKGKVWSKETLRSARSFVNEQLKKHGYYVCGTDDIEPETDIKSENVYFNSASDIVYWILRDGPERISLTITDELINKLNLTFNAKIKNVRSFVATLERYEKLIKVESYDFSVALVNENVIAKEMWEKIESISFGFLTKQLLLTLCNEEISKYRLLLDEPYYILTRNPKKNGKKYFFSIGNSMCISSSKELINLSIEDRMKSVFKTPVCMSRLDMSLAIGTNDYSTVNIKTLFYTGDNFLYYDVENTEHRKYVIEKFRPFIDNLKKTSFSISELKIYCEISNDDFLFGLKDHYSFSFVLKLFENEIKQNKSSKIWHLINSSNENPKKYIDINDWSDF